MINAFANIVIRSFCSLQFPKIIFKFPPHRSGLSLFRAIVIVVSTWCKKFFVLLQFFVLLFFLIFLRKRL